MTPSNDNDDNSLLGFMWRCDRIFAAGKGTQLGKKGTIMTANQQGMNINTVEANINDRN